MEAAGARVIPIDFTMEKHHLEKILSQTKRKIKLSKQEIGTLIDRFLVHSVGCTSLKDGEEVLYEQQFKQMIGVLGNFFIGKRMFETILKWSGLDIRAHS